MLLGGPLGSLLSGMAAALAIFTAKGSPWEAWWNPLVLIAAIGLGGFLVNLLPLRPDGLYSDGARLYQIFRRGVWVDVETAFAMVSSTTVTLVRPRDLDVEPLRRAADFLQHGKRGLRAQLFVCIHHLDAGQIAQANDALARAEAIYPEVATSLEPDLLSEVAFLSGMCTHAAHSKGVVAAVRGLQIHETRLRLLPGPNRASLAGGQKHAAHRCWEQGNAMAQRLPACGAYDFHRDCFELLKTAMDTPAVTAPVESEAEVPSFL